MVVSNAKPGFLILASDKVTERESVADILMGEGYRVVAVATADQAVAVIHARGEPRLVLADLNFAGLMDGYALARLVDLKWPGIALIVIDVRYDRPGDLPSKARFLPKPYTPSLLITSVQELLGEFRPL